MYCPNCGIEAVAEATYCPECGNALSKEKILSNSLISVCVACGNSIMQGDIEVTKVGGFWTCSSDCLREYKEANKGWSIEKVLRVKQWQEQAVRDARQQPHTAGRGCLPLWILIAINIIALALLSVVFTAFFIIALVIFDVIYIGVWVLLPGQEKEKNNRARRK